MSINGLTEDEQARYEALLQQLRHKQGRNWIRHYYIDAKYALKDMGIAIPPALTTMDMVLGWPYKAIETVRNHTLIDAWVSKSGETYDFAEDIWAGSNMDVVSSGFHFDVLSYGPGYYLVTKDTDGSVLIHAYDALEATGEWDSRRQRLVSFLALTGLQNWRVDQMLMIFDGQIIEISGDTVVNRVPTGMPEPGILPVQMFAHEPTGRRPFGRSRLSRPAMAFTDAALRSLFRSEVTAEFYSAPQRILMGATAEDFVDAAGNPLDQWKAVIGRIWGVPRDEDGNLPTIEQLVQAVQTPHLDQLKSYASHFAGEMSVPVSVFGFASDQPTGTGIDATTAELTRKSNLLRRGWAADYRQLARKALWLRDGKLDPAVGTLSPHWDDSDPAMQAARVDAVTKLAPNWAQISQSRVLMEMAGLDGDLIERALAEAAKQKARDALMALTARPPMPQQQPGQQPQQPGRQPAAAGVNGGNAG